MGLLLSRFHYNRVVSYAAYMFVIYIVKLIKCCGYARLSLIYPFIHFLLFLSFRVPIFLHFVVLPDVLLDGFVKGPFCAPMRLSLC